VSDPSRVRMGGPLAPFAEGFKEELLSQGYRPNAAADQLRLMAHLSRWLGPKGLDAGALTGPTTTAFLADRRAEGYRLWLSPKALAPLLAYLRSLNVAPPPPSLQLDPVEALLQRYRDYLIHERAVSVRVAQTYACLVRPFVAGRARNNGLTLADLTSHDITDFVLASCSGRTRGSAKIRVTAIRSLLGFLSVEGLIPAPMAPSVPSVAGWKLAGLPRVLEADEVARLLAACDRHSHTGRRDFAMLTLLVRLGLRAGEVCALQLDDFRWRTGEVVIHGKGNRVENLPLPPDVGEAVVGYLRQSRPPSAAGRAVFVRIKAPHRGLSTSAVNFAVRRAGDRAGVGPISTHALRHTAASQMLRAGVGLAEVGQVLRHQRLQTTAIYAKVDRDRLRSIARAWPGGAA
jgi:integrase/recombinase XerD